MVRTGTVSRSVIGECAVAANEGATGTATAKAQIKLKVTSVIDDRVHRAGELLTIGTTVARIIRNPHRWERSLYS